MSTPKKLNAAAMRRQRAELLEQRALGHAELPQEFVTWLERSYQPKEELQTEWPRLRPFVLATLGASHIRGEDSRRKHVTHLACFGAWAIAQGLVLDATTVVRRHTDEYCRTGMPGSSEKSRSDRRSRLRRLADQLNPDQAPAKTKVIARPSLKPPYPEEEMASIRRVSLVQPTEEMARQMCVCVGFGAGGGIDSADLKLLHGEHVKDLGELGIRVDVPGANARTVWVLREYEPIVRRAIANVGPSQPLLGREPQRHNVAGAVFARAKLYGDLPVLEQSRLRTTWLATLMSRPVPLAVICRAAGLKSTRTLFDLLPYLSEQPDAASLRDGGAR